MANNTFTIPGTVTGVGGITQQTFTTPATLTGSGGIVSGGGIARNKWASLSDDIIFEANQSAVEMMMKPNVAHFVEQELLVGKPRMQKLGLKLQEIQITVKFHFSVRPFVKIKAALASAAINGTVLQWIWGTGEAVGDFVIIDWKEKPKKTTEEGLIFATEIELSLKEYAGPGVAAQTGIDAKKAAFANKPLTQSSALPTMGLTSSNSLSANVQMVKVQNAKIGATLTKAKKAQMSLQAAKRDIQKSCGKIKAAINKINSAVDIAKNIKNANSITSAAALVGVATNSLSSAVGGSPTLDTLSGLSNDVSLATGSLGQVSQGAQVVKSWFATFGI